MLTDWFLLMALEHPGGEDVPSLVGELLTVYQLALVRIQIQYKMNSSVVLGIPFIKNVPSVVVIQ